MTGFYRGRIAPSPTGLLHLGHARTFWIAYQRAAATHGTLVFRNEDLDVQRSRAEYVHAMLEDLTWLGIQWQEGPDIGGPFAPYNQSERIGHYHAAWTRLVAGGWIYPCHCSRRDLARLAHAPHEEQGGEDDEPLYPGTCRPINGSDHAASIAGSIARIGAGSDDAAGSPHSWRFRVPDGQAIEFMDGRMGQQRYVSGRDFGDFLVWRRDGVPSYQLAVVVDDAAMQITEVVRGADLLKSTARQILLYRALDLPQPQWYHCALVNDTQGQRLAKRHDALSLRSLRASGATPDDVIHQFADETQTR